VGVKFNLVIAFFLSLNFVRPYSPEILDSVLINLKRLDFQKAKVLVNSNQDSLVANILDYLIELTELNTYRRENNTKLSFKKTNIPGLNQLVLGYENLYIHNNRVIALNRFIDGLSNSIENDEIELTKALIIGIFKVKQSGYSLTKEDSYYEYLQLFKENISDDLDKFWFHYYAIILLDNTIRYGEDLNLLQINEFKEHLKAMDEFSVSPNHLLRFLYYKEKGDLAIKIDIDNALEYFNLSENLLGATPYHDTYRFRLKVDKAIANSKMKNYRAAIDTILGNQDLIEKGNRMTNKLNNGFFLSQLFYKSGNADSAYVYLNKQFKLELESNHNKINEEVSAVEVELDTEKKEKQILVEQQRATKNRNWLIAATLALLFGSGIAMLLQKNTIKKRQLAEQEAVLKQQRVDNLLKEQELVSIDAMIAGQEKERQKVAGELHDDLGSLMATIKLHFDNAKVSKKDPALKNAQKLLEEAYQKIRGMAHSKNSGVMSDQGLLPAIKKLATTINQTNALKVTVEEFGLGERMENSLELSIFRMVQELVANAIKHAGASKVNIQFTQHEDNLNIIVEDDGKGFDRSRLDNTKSGMGLTNIEKRVEHLEGNFTVDSVLGKGTSILIDIPV
jgi:signal transduction histidine kinase